MDGPLGDPSPLSIPFLGIIDTPHTHTHIHTQDAFEAERPPGGSSPGGCNVALSLSWNMSRFDPPTMVVGGHTVKVRRGRGRGEMPPPPALAMDRSMSQSPPIRSTYPNVVTRQVWQYDDAARKWEVACVLSRGGGAEGGGGGIGGTIAGS